MASAPDGIHRLLSKLELTRLSRLCLSSRFAVEGQLQGAHRSPLKGFSVEFADYRQYVAGDDLRHLDWRVFGRSERLYIRQYEDECNLRVYLVVDGSKSMAYRHGDISKYNFAARLAAALAYVTVNQQDSVGLTICNDVTETHLPVKSGLAHLRLLAGRLAEFEPARETDLATNLHRLAEAIHRRALVVVLSDFYDDDTRVRQALAHFRRRKHDVMLYHILDRAEIEFPFRDLGDFQDLETGERLVTNPRSIRAAYQEAFSAFLNQVQALGSSLDLDYQLATTDLELNGLVRRHLTKRQRRR